MTVDFVVIALGALLLLTGIIGGGFEIREIKIPQVGRIVRIVATVAGMVLMLIGISMQPWSPSPTAATFSISDELGENQSSEQVTVVVNGKIVGNLSVNSDFPSSEMTVTVPQAGQYSYTVEATAYFYDPATGNVVSYPGVGQGMIQVDNGNAFRLAGSVSGNSWVVTLVES